MQKSNSSYLGLIHSRFRGQDLKAQSAIEYLTTYGWMLIAVSIGTGVAYTAFSPDSCQISVSQTPGGKVQVKQAAITSDNRLMMEMDSSAISQVEVEQVEVSDGSENYLMNRSFEVNGSEAVGIVEAERVDNCDTFSVDINYSVGSPYNEIHSLEIQAPANIIGEIIKYLEVGGGEIPALYVNSSIKPDGTLCIGNNCGGEIKENDEKVNRSGDTIKGLLKTEKLEYECIGGKCSQEEGTLGGYINYQNQTMDGTLNISKIQPMNNLCVGTEC